MITNRRCNRVLAIIGIRQHYLLFLTLCGFDAQASCVHWWIGGEFFVPEFYTRSGRSLRILHQNKKKKAFIRQTSQGGNSVHMLRFRLVVSNTSDPCPEDILVCLSSAFITWLPNSRLGYYRGPVDA